MNDIDWFHVGVYVLAIVGFMHVAEGWILWIAEVAYKYRMRKQAKQLELADLITQQLERSKP
jgi:hypothetical protein